jgi:TET-Associated Glycosyltransferase
MNPRYPVYVISKGRWESRLTVKALERMNVPHSVVIEPQEFKQYASVMDPAKLLTLPFSNLSQGSIPARNWVWKHAIYTGAERHWILDDNIRQFCRLYDNVKAESLSGSVFRAAEDFVDRYENVALAGFQYWMFIPKRDKVPPFRLNTRIYSCILIKNDLPYRWRGRYNEDTDLSLRALKDGWCTILFYAFFCEKMATMTMKGGNTQELYRDDGRLKMAESLVEQHPDVAKITRKWGRWQHQVDYRPFKKNRLILKEGVIIPDGVNNYGMELRVLDDEEDTHSRSRSVA